MQLTNTFPLTPTLSPREREHCSPVSRRSRDGDSVRRSQMVPPLLGERASGDTVRMYVHDPARKVEWDENLEITVYIRRIGETKSVSYSGLQIFARTNHGTTGDERKHLCDDRGYGAKVTVNGRWEFEKEI